MQGQELVSRISDLLQLTPAPVALSFVTERPADIPAYSGEVPSACSFWRAAETRTFYAAAAQHHNCPVGTMVMGFGLSDDLQKQLGELVMGMCAQQYLSPDEPPQIPTITTAPTGIVYGPLADRWELPDVVLLWTTPQQAMLCNEAMGTANWVSDAPSTTGRPGCAALPLAIGKGEPVLSFGCAGMRTFTRIGDNLLLVAVPGTALESFVGALEQTQQANAHMLGYYVGQRDRFATPTPAET